ncbi:MAG: electron transport complex subunit RsxD [Thiohalomonadales bacterium]
MNLLPFRSSPHIHQPLSVGSVMLNVIIALIPGMLIFIYFFGGGAIINLVIAIISAILFEAGILKLRKRPIKPFILDGSAVVTAILIALAIPPLVPWWIPFIGTGFAIVIAKHLYGGLGYNPFNPAMVGYAVLLISFPLHMTSWIAPDSIQLMAVFPDFYHLSFLEYLNYNLFGVFPENISYDSITMATPLDTVRTQLGLNKTIDEIQNSKNYLFGNFGSLNWEWINLMYLFGGLWLMYKRIISWHIPVGLLAGLLIMAMLANMYDPDAFVTPSFHLFSGATMLAAFFIATDPITAATSQQGRLYYATGIGILVYIIRTWGGYPDGVAFAVLLMNMAVPTIDYYTKPRVFGHRDNKHQDN